MQQGIVKISRSTIASRIFVFLLNLFPLWLTLVYLFFGSHQFIDITIGLIIITVNIILSWKLAFNDHEIWLDTVRQKVLVKRKKNIDEYSLSEFCEFRVAYYGMLSAAFKYYQLKVGGKKYRICFYTDRPGKITDPMDPGALLKNIEDEIRSRVCTP
jgi:hypothetical protein